MLSLCRQIDRQMDGYRDRQTTVKQYAPIFRYRGIKKKISAFHRVDNIVGKKKQEHGMKVPQSAVGVG